MKPLSPIERKVINLLLEGMSNKDIAMRLRISTRTVKAHFNRLFLRYGVEGGIKRVKLATMLYRDQNLREKCGLI